MYVCMYVYIYVIMHPYTDMHAYMHACMHAYMLTHICMHSYLHIYASGSHRAGEATNVFCKCVLFKSIYRADQSQQSRRSGCRCLLGHRMCSLTTERVLLLQNVFSYTVMGEWHTSSTSIWYIHTPPFLTHRITQPLRVSGDDWGNGVYS